MKPLLTVEEMEVHAGQQIRSLRLDRNLDQATLALRANISVRALRNLEAGAGSSLHTLFSVLRALDRTGWLDTLAPVASINPLMLSRQARPRQRASRARNADGKASAKDS